ncbi:bifunctional DNA-formamidopyrimidine glycosylase/DNA-(apurinic or apyrimidinic site) lyase [Paraferrimonas sedimenticola]|uniref:Formamidopyrimidine-DNA glycosylase n=1 Tax=Paraferrimonas sedimenticola TaxID=375674 RepID=A0AA37RXX3_9GAMM|nr:bifunctional DNA-formamidopyrimidine glycosylase/DNA-(apurinic or apyrimidinic site) lyase [Paraferrimonas sedimenticola]GLP97536.1 formamidopyrimidine-DNA glycosylase [Paraferrimonas sedimenticola]
MPELPEVEVTRLGIEPHIKQQTIKAVTVRQKQLRWPVSDALSQLEGQVIQGVRRRAKYLFIDTLAGSAIVHLGMSGSLRVLSQDEPPQKHDHVDLLLSNGMLLRYRDPRRFGAWLFSELPYEAHPLLSKLGPEPLSDEFNVDYLQAQLKGRTKAIKLALMDNHLVVGVGNIYANEALFMAGIDPRREAGRVSRKRLVVLVEKVKWVLTQAIARGGTSLQDFTQSDGKPGYFAQQLLVYGKAEEPCPSCGRPISKIVLGQRASFYCRACQS